MSQPHRTTHRKSVTHCEYFSCPNTDMMGVYQTTWADGNGHDNDYKRRYIVYSYYDYFVKAPLIFADSNGIVCWPCRAQLISITKHKYAKTHTHRTGTHIQTYIYNNSSDTQRKSVRNRCVNIECPQCDCKH